MKTQFEDIHLLAQLHSLNDSQLDELDFGVIAFDGDIVVERYNLNESQATGLKQERIIGSQLDELDFGVIAFDDNIVVKRYNLHECQATGLKQERVIGSQLFTEVAQCMNNYMVAQRFQDAREAARPLDETIDYVLTWRMRPTPVKLRLLSSTSIPLQYLLFKRGT